MRKELVIIKLLDKATITATVVTTLYISSK